MRDFLLSVGQWPVFEKKEENLARAEASLRHAAREGAQLALLPEMFQTPYELGRLRSNAEGSDGPTVERLSRLARELRLHVVAGSFCEKAGDAYHNTCHVFGPDGAILGTHRKIHLFDVSLETVRVQESSVLSPGQAPLVLDLPFCKLGVCICYDTRFRFPAIVRCFEARGVEVAAIPAAFSRTTGEAHWHLLMRSRAVEAQIFLAAACPAPNPESSYIAYGHSLIVDPWGTVLAEAGEGAAQISARLDARKLDKIRRELPLLAHRRPDLYARW
jgi:predicted amidohydrolase